MPYKNPAKQRKWAQNYYQTNKEKFREYYFENREELLKKNKLSNKKLRRKYREELLDLFQSRCLFCDKVLKLGKKEYVFHEINGIDHQTTENQVYLYIREQGRFVPLCKDCHKTFHTLMKLGKTFEEILFFIGWRVI